MKLMKKGTAVIVCLVMMLTIAQVDRKSVAAESVTVSGSVQTIDFYGALHLDISVDDFFRDGFDYGDIVTVAIGNESVDMPVGDDFMEANAYERICMVQKDNPTNPNVFLGTCAGDFNKDLAAPVSTGAAVTITMKEKGGYLEEYRARRIVRTYARTDYPNLTDEEFANFRVVSTTGMGEGVLCRSSSPVDPELNRNTYSMEAITNHGIKTVINANDSEDKMKAYASYPGSYYASCQVIPLSMEVEFRAPDFEKKLVLAFRFMIENPGPYLVHCVEGKDRTGFICAVLEALAGASADEILDDYMLTYYNYYGVKPGEKRYDLIRNGNLPITLGIAFGVSDLHSADLKACAGAYMKKIGLTDEEVEKLRGRLGVGSAQNEPSGASKIYNLKPNKTYKKYDVTCDGKADKIRVKYKKTKNYNNTMQIYINGKRVYKQKAYYLRPEVKILQFDKKKQLMEAGYVAEDDWNSVKLYSYKKKKWKLVKNLKNSGLSEKYSFGGNAYVREITGSTLKVGYRHQMPMIGADEFELTYQYDGNRMERIDEDVAIKILHYDGPDCNADGYENDAVLEAKREMTVYADSNTKSGSVTKIKKDDSVVFHKMRVVSKRPWFYVSIGEVNGWLPAGVSRYDENDNGDEGAGYYFKWLCFYG